MVARKWRNTSARQRLRCGSPYLPRPLASKWKLDHTHEGRHVICRIAYEQTPPDLVWKCAVLADTNGQFIQQFLTFLGGIVPCPGQKCPDAGMGEVVPQMLRVIAEQQKQLGPWSA